MKLHFSSKNIIERIDLIESRHGVEFIYCDTRREAESAAFDILREFYGKNKI